MCDAEPQVCYAEPREFPEHLTRGLESMREVDPRVSNLSLRA